MASSLMFPVPKSTVPLVKKMENNSIVTTEQRNWRDLPHDILRLISCMFSLLDLVSLSDVCSSWRIAMKNRTRIAYPALVILAQPKEKLMKLSDHGTEFFFLCINEKIKYKLKKRPWLVDQHSRIIGSHRDGWVILANPATWQYFYGYREVYIVHLFRKIQIQLPKYMMGSNTGLVKFNGGSITKATLSANVKEYFIVAITSNNGIRDNNTLALWRYGDCNWTCFGGESRRITDIAVCGNTIYALHGSGPFGKHLESWELKRNLSLPERRLCIELPRRYHSDHEFQCLHVQSADEIYVVEFSRFTQNRQLFICKLDSKEKKWKKVNSLNGQALLFCFGNSAILSSTDVERLGYKANSIYLVKKEQKHIKVSIYHFDEGIYKLNETNSCMRDEYHDMQPLGLFSLST